MTFVIIFSMLLFLGFCAVILVMGISDILRESKSGKPGGVKTAQKDATQKKGE